MHEYSGVDVLSLDDQQIKVKKGTTTISSIKKDDEQKKYSILVKDGEIFCFYY
jgi:hypothetical protein